MKLFGIELIDVPDFVELLLRFSLNFLIVVIIVKFLYYNQSKRRDYVFTYLLIGSIIFLICFLLDNVKLELGFALGLFAIFGIIRYRTRQIPIREMTYLFMVIGISVINALSNKKVSYAELLFTNLILIVITFYLEKIWKLRHESRKIIEYENIELIKPENRDKLIEDLKNRTGLAINRVEIGKINFLRDSARIYVYYYISGNTVVDADDEMEYDDGD